MLYCADVSGYYDILYYTMTGEDGPEAIIPLNRIAGAGKDVLY